MLHSVVMFCMAVVIAGCLLFRQGTLLSQRFHVWCLSWNMQEPVFTFRVMACSRRLQCCGVSWSGAEMSWQEHLLSSSVWPLWLLSIWAGVFASYWDLAKH